MRKIYFKTLKTKYFKEIKRLRSGVWIHIEEAAPSTLEDLALLLKLDYADLGDSLDLYEIPRMEKVDGNVLIFIRNPARIADNLFTETLAILLSPKYFVTISPQKNPLFDQIITEKNVLTTTQQGKLLAFILIKVVKEFGKEVRAVNQAIQKQRKNFYDINNQDIVQLIEYEEIFNQYLAALVPMKAMFKTLVSGKSITFYEEDQDLFEDLIHEIQQLIEVGKVNLRSIESLRDSYQIIFTNNLNKRIKFLTSLTILLTIPTIIGSLYGMNVALPFGNHPLAFSFVTVFTLIILGIAAWIFSRKNWL